MSGVAWGRLGRAARAARVALARRDPCVFVSGLTDPLTGRPLYAAPFQRAWHEAIERQPRLVLWAPVEHGKTTRLQGHTIWRLGRNPRMHGLIVGESAGSAIKILSAVRRMIDEDPWVREVFPHLRPLAGKYAKWTDEAIRVEGQLPGDKDYSLQAVGVGGSILGARLDWVWADDVCSFHTTATALQRAKVRDWWASTITGRLLAGATALVSGNAWFPDDVMHWLTKEAAYASSKVEAYQEAEDGSVRADSILWPERFTAEELTKRVTGYGSHVEARRNLRCVAYSSGSSQFEIEWFDRAFLLGSELWGSMFGSSGHARGSLTPRFLHEYHGPLPTFTGVDLGVGVKAKNDQSCLFTIAADAATGRKFVIHVESGRWKGPELIDKIRDVHRRYGSRILVENNAGQDFLVQWLQEKGVLVEGFTTTGAKADPRFGVPAIATELSRGLWVLPEEPELHKWRAQCLDFDPSGHVGDRLMASWFAREAARTAPMVTPQTVEPDNVRSSWNLRGRYDLGTRRGLLRRVS